MSKLFGIIPLACIAIWAVPAPITEASSDTLVPECELAAEWVEANLDALPTTLEAFGEHSITFRRAIYGALDTDVRISLWRENLATVAHEATSPEQRLFLERVSRDLDVYVLGTAPQSEIAALEEEAKAVLGKPLAGRALVFLGPVPEPVASVTENGGSIGEAQDDPQCACSTKSDFCGFPDTLMISCVQHYPCDETLFGCGFLFLFRCDGLCEF